ncbi:MAG: hypothetical protein Q9221_002827 [Calogaya cf. arnoldii]
MALRESVVSNGATDGNLPEVTPSEGLERRIPESEQKQLHLPDQDQKQLHLPDHDQKQLHLPDHEEKEYHPATAELSPENWRPNHPASPNAYGSNPDAPQPQRERAWWKRKRFWIPLAALLLIGAIVGGVVGSLSNRNNGPSSDNEAPTEPPDPAAAAQPPSPKSWNSSLASVAWSASGGLGYRRLYYQDDAGTIKESAWNSSGNEWYSSNESLGKGKLRSPIAASVAGNITWPFQLNLYYVDPDGLLIERYTKDGQTWESGGLTNDDIIPSPNSDLATTWSQTDHKSCDDCGQQTVLLAYQDSNDKIWVVNATGPNSQLTTLEAAAAPGTGLASHLVWFRQESSGIRLYYQKGADDLMTIDYENSNWGAQQSGNTAWQWTLHEDSPIGNLTDGASIASFAFGDDPERGIPLFHHTVSSGSRGISVAWLGGGTNSNTGWQAETPDVMKDVQPFSAVAANADRHVYAFVDGVVKDFVVSTDGTTWSLVGDVFTMF